VYLYHSFTDNRHIIGLFYPHLEQASVFVVGSPQDQMPRIQRIYSEIFSQKREQNPESLGSEDIFSYPEDLRITLRHFADAKSAFKAVSQELMNYQEERRGPTILVFFFSFLFFSFLFFSFLFFSFLYSFFFFCPSLLFPENFL